MWHSEFLVWVKREQFNDYLAAARRDHLVAALQAQRLTVARRAARPVGRTLLRLGTALLRYGRVENQAPVPDTV